MTKKKRKTTRLGTTAIKAIVVLGTTGKEYKILPLGIKLQIIERNTHLA